MTNPYPPGPKFNTLDVLVRQFTNRQEVQTLDDMRELARGYDGIMYYKVGPFKVYIIWKPDYVHEAIVEQAGSFGKGFIVRRAFGRLLGEGLFTSDGEFWKRQRRLAQPAFHSRRIEAYAGTMVEHTTRMLSGWDRPTLEINDEMMSVTMNVVAKTLFNADVSEDRENIGQAMAALVETVFKQSNGLVILPAWVPTRDNIRQTRALKTMDEIIYRIVAARRTSGEDTGDLLSMLLLARDEDGSQMSDRQLRDEAMTLFIAGHETTAVALTWAWYYLSQHPEVEARLHAELDTVLAGRAPTLADLANLPYTEQVIKETMRLRPPVPLIPRQAMDDAIVGGFRVDKNSGVLFGPYLTQHDGAYFENPDVFLPERWTDNLEKRLPRYAYFPFGGGPRVCIGNQFAMMEARLILATVAQRFQLALVPGQQIEPLSFLSLRPKHGMKMVAHVRQPIPTTPNPAL